MAVPAKKPRNQRTDKPSRAMSDAQRLAVLMYADGKGRRTICKVLAQHIMPLRYKQQRKEAIDRVEKVVRRWENTQWFRDAVYDAALVRMDMGIPDILNGIRHQAQKGRVDAARLALEVTGRHSMREGSMAPAVVNISLGAVPRPNRAVGGIPQQAELPEGIEDADFEVIGTEVPSTEDDGRSDG